MTSPGDLPTIRGQRSPRSPTLGRSKGDTRLSAGEVPCPNMVSECLEHLISWGLAGAHVHLLQASAASARAGRGWVVKRVRSSLHCSLLSALAIALGACGAGPSKAGPVPWIDSPVPTPNPTRLAALLPPCLAKQLAAHLYPSGGTAGTVIYRVQVLNISRRICALRGHPDALSGVTMAGASVALSPSWMSVGSPYVDDQPAPSCRRKEQRTSLS